MVGYYRQHIADFATVVRPLTYLTSKEVPWKWEQEEQSAFEKLKEKLVTAPVLGYPEPDGEHISDTDASAVIAYYSKTLTPAEKNYCVTRRELLAVVKGMKHFRPYLYGRHFRLRTHHACVVMPKNGAL